MLGLGLGLGFTRGGTSGGGAPAVIPLRVMSTQNRLADQRSNSATRNAFGFRVSHVVCRTGTDLVVAFNNFYMNATFNSNTGAEFDTGNDYTLSSVSIEAPNGTVVAVNFSGGRTKTLANGDFDIQSDAIDPADFGYSEFPAGTYWIKGIGTVPGDGQFIPTNALLNSGDVSGMQYIFYDTDLTTASSTDAAGVYTATGTAFTTVSAGLCPILLGHPTVDAESYIIIGDSIAAGTGDNSSNGVGGRGFIQRGLYNYGTDSLPAINCAVPSARNTLFTGGTKWKAFIPYCRYAIEELGTNPVNDAVAYATIQTQLQTVWTALTTGGVSRIYRTGLMTYTTTTDTYATQANQTIQTGWNAGESAPLLNAWFQTLVGTTLYAYISSSYALDVGGNLKWRTDDLSSAGYSTTDGLHPGMNGHSNLAWPIRQKLIEGWTQSYARISNMTAWWDSIDTATILDENGVNAATGGFTGNVATWTNKANSSANATQTTPGKRPTYTSGKQINGINVVNGDGVDDSMVFTTASVLPLGAGTVAGVITADTTTTSQRALANAGSGGASTRYYFGNQSIDFGNTTIARAVPATGAIGQIGRHGTTGAGVRQRVNLNGDTQQTGTLTRSNPTLVNSRLFANGNDVAEFFDGGIGDVMVYTKQITPAESDYIASLMTSRWGVTMAPVLY